MSTSRMTHTRGTILVLATLALLVPSVAVAGQPSNAAEPLPLDDAKAQLEAASSLLGDRTAKTSEVKKALEVLAAAHAQAGGKARELNAFRRKAEALLLKALTIYRAARGKRNVNKLAEVNVRAAELLGDTAAILDAKRARALSLKIRKAIEVRIEKDRKPKQWQADHLQAAFGALAKLNDHGTLSWIVERYHHSKEREIPFLIAAHRALVCFRAVPGKLRQAVCDTMITAYAGVETAAGRSSNEAADVAAKRIWDRIRLYTVPVLQYYAGQPKNSEGEALSTVAEFKRWWRDHRNLRKAPWKD